MITMFLALAIPLNFLLPSKETMYKMVAASYITKENIDVVGDEIDKITDKIIEKNKQEGQMIKNFKTGREYLQEIYNQHRRYLSVQRELAECKAHIYQIKGQRYEKDKVSGGIQPDLSDRVILVEKYEEMVVQEHEDLIIMRIEARRLIDMIKKR